MDALQESHIGEETIESYAMGKLRGEAEDQVEEHLLFCGECQDRLQETDQFIAAYRIAAGQIAINIQTEAGAPPWWKRLGESIRAMVASMRLSHAAGALATVTLAVVFLAPKHVPDNPAIRMELTTVRGLGSAVAARGATLLLSLDLQGLPEQASYKVEIADAVGNKVWGATARTASKEKISVKPGKLSEAGVFWVRIYEPGTNGVLLREFALEVK